MIAKRWYELNKAQNIREHMIGRIWVKNKIMNYEPMIDLHLRVTSG